MKNLFIFSLFSALLVGCATFIKVGSNKSTYTVNLSELPSDKVESLKQNLSLASVDQAKNNISLSATAHFELVKSFVQTAILNDNINEFDFYFKQSRPRLRYWEYIVSQLPEYVDYGYTYNSYSSDSADEKGKMLAFLSYRMNRDAKNITKLFQSSKSTIYGLISPEKYREYQLDEYVNTLIDSYNHLTKLTNYKAQMERIYAQVLEEDKIEDIFGRTSHQYPIYEPIINDDIQAKYFGSNGMVLNEFGEYTDVLWFHSFWVRRYHENNSEAIMKILTEIQKHYAI